MITIEKCREILEKNNKDLPKLKVSVYSDEEIVYIRDFLYKMARINIDYVNEKLGPEMDLREIFKEQRRKADNEVCEKRKKKKKEIFFYPEPRIFKLTCE
jgi:hypothetical protein